MQGQGEEKVSTAHWAGLILKCELLRLKLLLSPCCDLKSTLVQSKSRRQVTRNNRLWSVQKQPSRPCNNFSLKMSLTIISYPWLQSPWQYLFHPACTKMFLSQMFMFAMKIKLSSPTTLHCLLALSKSSKDRLMLLKGGGIQHKSGSEITYWWALQDM